MSIDLFCVLFIYIIEPFKYICLIYGKSEMQTKQTQHTEIVIHFTLSPCK